MLISPDTLWWGGKGLSLVCEAEFPDPLWTDFRVVVGPPSSVPGMVSKAGDFEVLSAFSVADELEGDPSAPLSLLTADAPVELAWSVGLSVGSPVGWGAEAPSDTGSVAGGSSDTTEAEASSVLRA
jgi:hypothetical protein